MLLLLAFSCAARVAPARPHPPDPPPTGPGAAVYPHADVVRTKVGRCATRAWRYDPASPAAPEDAPVVVVLHGWGRPRPARYEDLLEHLARRGYRAIYPAQGAPWAPRRYVEHSREAIAAALPEGTDRIALVGHSLGGLVALRLAAEPGDLPPIAALILHDPAGAPFVRDWDLSPAGLATIPPATPLLALIAPDTWCADVARGGDAGPLLVDRGTAGLDRRALLVVPTDTHGDPPLISDHLAAQSGGPRPLDAVDTWGYRRPTEAALAEVLLGEVPAGSVWCDPATGCEALRDRGSWSDGVPVAPLSPAPPACP